MPDYEDWLSTNVYNQWGELVVFGVDKPLPDWDDYVPGYGDWDNYRHSPKWPFGSRSFPSPLEFTNPLSGNPTFTFYRGPDQHGSYDWKGKYVVFPDGNLSNAEIAQAANQAPDPPGTFTPQFQVQVYTPPAVGNQVYVAENVKKYLAVIDYTEWLTMRDYYMFKKHIHERNVDLLGSPNQYNVDYNEYHALYFIPIESYLERDIYYKNRPGPLQIHFDFGGNEYIYQAPELNDE